jgi:hypothetical protein
MPSQRLLRSAQTGNGGIILTARRPYGQAGTVEEDLRHLNFGLHTAWQRVLPYRTEKCGVTFWTRQSSVTKHATEEKVLSLLVFRQNHRYGVSYLQ